MMNRNPISPMENEDGGGGRGRRKRREVVPLLPGMSTRQVKEMISSWRLRPDVGNSEKKVGIRCIVFFIVVLMGLALWIALPISLHNQHTSPPPLQESYTVALKQALLLFDAQMSGRLPKNHRVPWRGDSGLNDGGLVGGYYDSGSNLKINFPMAFTMTTLSWSVLEYGHKYKALGEYEHLREIIKWGTDYLLLAFNSSAPTITTIYDQVGLDGSTTPDDLYCWQRPEDMKYGRPVLQTTSVPDLAAEMAAALASASIVFRDDREYTEKLVKGAISLLRFALESGASTSPTRQEEKQHRTRMYNSTDFYDEYMWGASWLYYATGNFSYLSLATSDELPEQAKAFLGIPELRVFSWDNKLPAAELLLTRVRISLSPPFPYESRLRSYHEVTKENMCSYLQGSGVFNFTKGGMIQLSQGRPQRLQYVVNAAFVASLFFDYMNAMGISGFDCGSHIISTEVLHHFATSQMDYILGANPYYMSYVVGYGDRFPRYVHHRGASIPDDGNQYSCTEGWKWRDSEDPNPNNITGAMVGGPDEYDAFYDVRTDSGYTEPTLAGNAGLVAALVSLTSSGGIGVDVNTIFSGIWPFHPPSPPTP